MEKPKRSNQIEFVVKRSVQNCIQILRDEVAAKNVRLSFVEMSATRWQFIVSKTQYEWMSETHRRREMVSKITGYLRSIEPTLTQITIPTLEVEKEPRGCGFLLPERITVEYHEPKYQQELLRLVVYALVDSPEEATRAIGSQYFERED